MGWTGFDGDDQATLALNLVTGHGRAMPSLWLSVWKDELKDRRNDFEDACPLRLSKLVRQATESHWLQNTTGELGIRASGRDWTVFSRPRRATNATLTADQTVTAIVARLFGNPGRAGTVDATGTSGYVVSGGFA